MKSVVSCIVGVFIAVTAVAAENVHFLSKPLTAGKASLTENGFLVSKMLGTANFSPELRFPIQLVYESASEKSGLFGYAWKSPQLESSAVPERDGVLWTTPWGEKIKFFRKQKPEKDAVKVELYEQEMKASDFFAPYSEWKADTSAPKGKFTESGNWIFSGKRDYTGWKFTYRDAKLQRIDAPSGRFLQFTYASGKLVRISQNDQAFVEIGYDASSCVSSLRINGIEHKISYASGDVSILPKTQVGELATVVKTRIASIWTGGLNPAEYAYDANGYLTQIKQGAFVEELKVQMETLADRRANVAAKADRKLKASGKAAGRLLSDAFFTYSYTSQEPGGVRLTNKLQQTATYDFSEKTGVFKVTEFSGKNYTIYYFMRMDVAYLGKVRQIVDGRGRTVLSYRYDKLTGRILRVRDRAENDLNFEYTREGNLSRITRRAADQNDPEPVVRYQYDPKNNPVEIARLNEKGIPAVTTSITYDFHNQPLKIGDGRTQTRLQYNNFGYPVAVTNVFNQTQEMSFDKYNRLVSATDLYGVKTLYSYTDSGLIAKIRRVDGKDVLTSLSVSYNGNGQPVAYTDQAGRVKKFDRDAFGRVVKEFFPDETSVEYTYNAVGQLHKVLDQNRNTITFDWNRFGLDKKTTAAHQLTDYVHDKYGMLARVDSKLDGKTDRSIQYEYDNLDRLTKVTYGKGEVETFQYDSWGKLIASTRGDKKATFEYDYFGRMIQKSEDGAVTRYLYNAWGQRTGRELKNGALKLTEYRKYDAFGRLTEIEAEESGKTVKYVYNAKNQLAVQVIDNVPVEFTYTKYGQLESKILGGRVAPVSALKYVYSKDGMIVGREIDKVLQTYQYDKKGQLLAVIDSATNKAVEQYTYDPAGNILRKTIHGKTTTFTYDKANQLVTSTVDGKVTKYAYDAAGRLVKEGDKVYSYGWLDKILSVQENDKQTASFDYHIGGQIASATTATGTENFRWDGLALIHRGKTAYVNEPYITGGNPILAFDPEKASGLDSKVLFTDILGTTLGAKEGDQFNRNSLTAFGESSNASFSTESSFFTGKPYVGELGYAFLFRNYRADQGKWQTADPLGYPDGWNNLAYVNNGVFLFIDWLGAASAFVQGREVNNTFGLFSHLSLHYTVTPSEYAQLTPAQQAFFHASPVQILPGEGQVYLGHISGFPSNNLPALTGAHLTIDPLNVSDGLGETDYIGAVTPQGSSSQFDMLKSILNAAIVFQNNQTGTDYDWFPNDPDEGNSNTLIGNLILNGGGIAPQNIPNNAAGFSHVMGRQFYE
ncbi:MAG: tRNA(Glu)-specific nuclease WapA precursor [Lentisphaerae bacterium ADurb.Bin242]|nr:MAG: tRNA(Glu)-specific nuclease WapA precursor [Lentisphaerae bacterium ADurb.Bin242]